MLIIVASVLQIEVNWKQMVNHKTVQFMNCINFIYQMIDSPRSIFNFLRDQCDL